MKTKIILTLMALFSFAILTAQDVATFRVDDNYYSIVQTNKEYKFQEYSTLHGGKFLATKEVSSNMEQRFVYTIKQQPAFYLHKKTKNYPQGDNTVIYLPTEEFILENIRLTREQEGVYLKWDAIVNDNIRFEIYQIKETVPVLLEKINPIGLTTKYEYVSSLLDKNHSYILKVIKNDTKHRYEHVLKNLATEPKVIVYPSVTKGRLHVDLDDMDFANYSVTSMNGQMLKNGKFYSIHNTVFLEGTPGIYLINVWNEQVKISKRITISR